jgi:hypothetical protein
MNRWTNPSWWNLMAALPLVLFSAFQLQQCFRYQKIAKRQTTAFGTVNAHEPANHNRYGYIFVVGEKQYSGWGHPAEPRMGQPVTVYYDPQDPSENALNTYDDACGGLAMPIAFPIVILLVMVAFIARQRHNDSRVFSDEQ